MTTEFDWQQLYSQTQSEIKQVEIYLQSLYNKRVIIRKQMLEVCLNFQEDKS